MVHPTRTADTLRAMASIADTIDAMDVVNGLDDPYDVATRIVTELETIGLTVAPVDQVTR